MESPKNLTLNTMTRDNPFFTHVLDGVFDGVYIVDRDRKIVYWNRGAQEITGYSADDVDGRCCANNILCHLDEQGVELCRTACPLLRAIEQDINVRAKVYPLRKNGGRIPVETHISPIHDVAGKVIGAIEVFRDITAQEEYRILQEKFARLIRRYVSQTTYDDVLVQAQTEEQSGAARRELTVFFADVVGFTSISESSPPDVVLALLNDFFAVCEVVTAKHHGDIDKFMGDAALAVFFDANDAVNAAKGILGALVEVNSRRAAAGAPRFQIRIGINSGPVVQGDVGGAERKDLTVIGDAVNTAARIEKLCTPGAIRISEATWSRLRESDGFVPCGHIALRGKTAEIALFELNSA